MQDPSESKPKVLQLLETYRQKANHLVFEFSSFLVWLFNEYKCPMYYVLEQNCLIDTHLPNFDSLFNL
jgi:hypothetical protein